MDTALLDYDLPEALIAQHPAARRDHSRLLVVDRQSGNLHHERFDALPRWLPAKTALFFNDVAVLKARLPGQRPTGGRVECLLLTPETSLRWRCLLKPGRRLAAGSTFGWENEYQATVVAWLNDGMAVVEFELHQHTSVVDLAETIGRMPLPPYIRREDDPATDDATYQTVYANPDHRQAVAAPTAGLHFTPELLQTLDQAGFSRHHLTLNVGLGTFRPIQCDQVEEHRMHEEAYTVPATVRQAHREATHRLAVGTTTLRALEHYMRREGPSVPPGDYRDVADLFIYPPQHITAADMMITNFHLPRSTLLCLVATFLKPGEPLAGMTWLHAIYREAIKKEYRFFSYGDAMLIR